MGILYIIATPIGNLKDITFRALEVLGEVDLILCEDTRETLKLLNHYQISKHQVSYFQHSKLAKVEYIIDQLRQGKKLGLVSDAGTPGISDPGGKLINKILASPGLVAQIVPIPGPNAAVAALSISGFPTDKFLFLGFPPAKKKRKKFFEEASKSKYTAVFYESPYRIIKTLKELIFLIGQREVIVCRELTKKFETIYRGNVEEVIRAFEQGPVKGEFVVIVSPSLSKK